MKTYDYSKGRYNVDSYRETDILDLSEFQKKSTERSLNSIYTFFIMNNNNLKGATINYHNTKEYIHTYNMQSCIAIVPHSFSNNR